MKQIPENFSPAPDRLRDKVILVTGATGGFGKPLSLALAAHGATVILLGRNLRLLEGLYDEIEQAGHPTPAIYPMNLEGATESDYTDLANNVDRELGRLDGLVHAAALLGAPTPFVHSDTETWYQVHQVNLHAPYLLTRACLPLLGQAEPGSIVFFVDDKVGAFWDAYQVSKRGLAAMAQLLAAEYEGSRLRVNCFDPGKTLTSLQLRAFPAADDNDSLPRPQDHLATLLYLLGDDADEHGCVFSPRD